MKSGRLLPLSLLALSSLTHAAAPPLTSGLQLADMGQSVFALANDLHSEGTVWVDEAKQVILRGKKNLEKWFHKGRQYIKQDNLLYEFVTHPNFMSYDLRLTKPRLCDPSVKQYSGYLDVADNKHLFFWFFEARNSPSKAPLVLWLNGGPGCSSTTGLLAELGPCRVVQDGHNTTLNPYSWNANANIIFLDQPINVGYSYADDDTTVSSSPVAGKDVYAFLQIFLNRFPMYAKAPFHIAAESYGGVYAPNFASIIFKQNTELAAMENTAANLRHINLRSIILANGLTDPYIQLASIPDYVCDGPYPVYPPDHPQCGALRTKVPTCQRLIKMCYNTNSRFPCVGATVYCNTQIMAPLFQTGLNPYDVRLKCDRSKDGPLCYRKIAWIDTWMNNPANKAALGVNPELTFESCSNDVNRAFTMNGDGMHNSAALLPELVDGGVRLLVYAGNADMMCNYMGNERWVEQLPTQFHDEFFSSKPVPWVTSYGGKVAGEVRSAGGEGFTAGNVTFVNVYEAGHMVPYDQPEAAFDLFTRWIGDTPLSLQSEP